MEKAMVQRKTTVILTRAISQEEKEMQVTHQVSQTVMATRLAAEVAPVLPEVYVL